MNAMKLAIPLFVALAYGPAQGFAGPILGSDLATFAVLGATGVTNVAPSTIAGNVGSFPTASVDGGLIFTSGSVNNPLAVNAQTQLDAAILALNNPSLVGPLLPPLGSGDLTTWGPIPPGNYTVPDLAINISGAVTLDGGDDPNALWVFHFPSTTLTTSTTSEVNVINVGSGAGVGLYWDVGTTAVLNGPVFAGNVLAGASITSDGNLTIACGRLLAATGNVTLIQDTISIGCVDTDTTTNFEATGGLDQGVAIGSGGTGGSNSHTVPGPATLLLLGVGLTGLFTFRNRLFPVA